MAPCPTRFLPLKARVANPQPSHPASTFPRQLHGYDRERFDDATTLNDTTRDDATHDALPTPTTTHAPDTFNKNAD